jgi:hypothetical protein
MPIVYTVQTYRKRSQTDNLDVQYIKGNLIMFLLLLHEKKYTDILMIIL